MGCSFKHSHPQIQQEFHQEAKTSPLGQSHYFDSVQPVHLAYFLSLSSGGQTSNMVCCKATHLLVPWFSQFLIFLCFSGFFYHNFPLKLPLKARGISCFSRRLTLATPRLQRLSLPTAGAAWRNFPWCELMGYIFEYRWGPFESWNIWDFMTNTYVYIIASTFIVMH